MNCNLKYPVLNLINTPKELRLLSEDNLIKLCNELRQFLLTSVSKSSGHFASGLGTVELTVALHYVYNTPFDYLIWDIGHQAYPHKILTGRRERIFSIRKRNGLHPFPCRNESEYDTLSVGHSSTSISAGLGLAIASEREMLGRRTVCVIGDGAITAGMAFEAINHAGFIKSDLLIILNDNEMSISENVGALNNSTNHVVSQQVFSNIIFNNNDKKIVSDVVPDKKLIKNTNNEMNNPNASNSLFSQLGFNYIGPINGHDVLKLVYILRNIRDMKGPQFLHVITKKGFGYKPAEKDPIKWHSVPQFDPTSESLPTTTEKNTKNITYSSIFGNWLCQVADSDKKVIGITPAMREGSGMSMFSQKYPKQYFDVAIAEQHAVTFAAGLAIAGYKPVVAIYSTFLQRAYDQVIHDVAIQNLPILFAVDRGGIVGADGPTHQGAFDLSYLRCIPNMIIMTPSDAYECKLMLHTGYNYKYGPSVVRYPKGCAVPGNAYEKLYILPLSKGVIRRQGNYIAILNFGTLLQSAYNVASKLNATLVDMRFVKPLDETLIKKLTRNHQVLITLEENTIIGGAGSGVNEFLMKNKILIPVLNIGLPDFFISQGSRAEILSELELDSIGIYKKITKWMHLYN